MRIIEKSQERQITCPNCGSLYAYTEDDAVDINGNKCTKCPVCSEVNDFEAGTVIDEQQPSQKELAIMKKIVDKFQLQDFIRDSTRFVDELKAQAINLEEEWNNGKRDEVKQHLVDAKESVRTGLIKLLENKQNKQ